MPLPKARQCCGHQSRLVCCSSDSGRDLRNTEINLEHEALEDCVLLVTRHYVHVLYRLVEPCACIIAVSICSLFARVEPKHKPATTILVQPSRCGVHRNVLYLFRPSWIVFYGVLFLQNAVMMALQL